CQQRLAMPSGVVGVRVRDEGERAHDERIEPEPLAGQRDAAVPDDMACQRCALTPTRARASFGMPMSATVTSPARRGPSAFNKPAFGSVNVTVAPACTVGA